MSAAFLTGFLVGTARADDFEVDAKKPPDARCEPLGVVGGGAAVVELHDLRDEGAWAVFVTGGHSSRAYRVSRTDVTQPFPAMNFSPADSDELVFKLEVSLGNGGPHIRINPAVFTVAEVGSTGLTQGRFNLLCRGPGN